ncbi:MAG: DUF2911 domain-containing protein [Bacteroidota bacterium]
MKFLKWLLIVLGVLALLFFFVIGPYMKKQTKKHSPETTISYTKNGLDLSVNYSSPSKKGRVIFGELVPYDAVWRTGANEPTTFTTASDIKIIDKDLPSGTYSLWAKPNKQHWDIMFNSDIPDWGVTISSGGRETTRKPESDVVKVQVQVENLSAAQESFRINFEDDGQLYLTLSWDTTKVSIPINR